MNSPETTRLIKGITNDLSHACQLIEHLKGMGYVSTFELVGTKLMCRESGRFYPVVDLIVDDIFLMDRFDEHVDDYLLYTLHARDNSVKGIFTAYPVPESLQRYARHAE